MTDLFSGAGSATITDRLPKWPPGKYVAKVVRAFAKSTFNSGDAFIVECAVVVGTPASPPSGDEPAHSFFQSFSHNRAMAQGAVLAFTAALFGFDSKDKARFDGELRPMAEALMKAATTESNPWCGLLVGVDSYVKPYTSKKTGETIADNTNQRYFPTSYYEENRIARPTMHEVLARAGRPQAPSPVWGAPPPPNTYAAGTYVPPGAPPFVAPPPPVVAPPPPAGPVYPPGTIFHPAPPPAATHHRQPHETTWTLV